MRKLHILAGIAVALLIAAPAATQSPFVGLVFPPQTVMGNPTSQSAFGQAIPFAQLSQTILTSVSAPVSRQVFTSSGTYTPTGGTRFVDVTCAGGGGGGGGAPSTSATQISAGAGGASGGVARSILSAATIGTSQTVTIGAAGTTGVNVSGGNGGNTTFGALLTANGGQGGSVGSLSTTAFIFGGANGGSASGGNVYNIQGKGGEDGWGMIVGTTDLTQGGCGGYTPLGLGTGGACAMSGSGAQIGNGASGFGAGGSGGAMGPSGTQTAGGAATAGICIVLEYQ